MDQACEQYELVLMRDEATPNTVHQVAFDMAAIYQNQRVFDKAATYYGLAIEAAAADVINTDPMTLSKYYLARAQAFDALGMTEHARLDHLKIQEADPNYQLNINLYSKPI